MWGAIAGAIGGVASTILGNNSAKHEAERDRDWQENMSNTSIQRRVADLKAAGLNPLLAVQSAQSGASTPTGAKADIKHFDFTQAISAYLASKQGKVADTQAEKNIVDAEKAQAEKNNIELQNLKAAEDIEGQKLDNVLKRYDTVRSGIMIELEKENVNTQKLQNDILKARSEKEKLDILEKNKILEKLNIEVKSEEDKARYLKAMADIAENDAKSFENSTFGKNVKYGFDRAKDVAEIGEKILKGVVPEVKFTVFENNGKSRGTSKTVKKRGRSK